MPVWLQAALAALVAVLLPVVGWLATRWSRTEAARASSEAAHAEKDKMIAQQGMQLAQAHATVEDLVREGSEERARRVAAALPDAEVARQLQDALRKRAGRS